jgi:hypothetical protein
VERADDAEAAIERLLRPSGIRLGQPQLRRLAWLARRFGAPTLWDTSAHLAANDGFVIVIDPPHGAGAELLCRSLQAGSVVAIPFGENPAFDFLKSKLTDFGTIGACGVDYPHELWWGGLEWPIPDMGNAAIGKMPRIVSCFPCGLGENHALPLRLSAQRLRLDFDIEAIDAVFDDRMFGFEKADFIARMWKRHGGPLLFVEADAVLREPPLLPAHLDCDFAAHRWNRWEMSARTIYFGSSGIAETLLHTWQNLCATYPSVWDGYLLDQAWSLTSSQMPLDTIWLPRSYHALAGDIDAQQAIVHNIPTTSFDLGPDPDFSEVAREARRAARTGARDSLLVVDSPVASDNGVTVILRSVEASGARTMAASIEAVTEAFNTDCGGFGRLELSLCTWKEDVQAAKEAARNAKNQIIEIAPWQELSSDLFRSFARSVAANHVHAVIDRRG